MSAQPDLFGMYFKLYESTEPPLIYHRWSLVTCLSAYLERRFWMPFGSQRIFPNFYTMLIGHPGARKSTAIKLGKKIFSIAGYTSYAAEKTSKEKFLLDLEGLTTDDIKSSLGGKMGGGRSRSSLTTQELHEQLFGNESRSNVDREPKQVYIVADEFNEFAGSGNLEFLSLLGMLWDWDDELQDYQYRLKNSKSVSIYQPTVSILAGNTHAGFVEAFPPQAVGQGFLSRLVLVYGEPSGKKIAFPPPPDTVLRDAIVSRLLEIKQKVIGPATPTPDAHDALTVIYNTWKDLEDGRFKHYSNRRQTHLLKLVLVVAAARCSTTVTESDVILANTILSYTESDMPKALGEFGKSRDSDIAGKIMSALWETNDPLSVMQLMRLVKNDLDKNTQLGDILIKLQNSDQIQNVPGRGFLPKQKIMNSRQVYINLDLLKEYTMKHHGLRVVK